MDTCEDECRLTGMAPEGVCMLAGWMGVEEVLEARTSCRTLKRAADETVPWMPRREQERSDAWRLLFLSAAEVETMRRVVLHASDVPNLVGVWATHAAAEMGSVDVIAYLRTAGHKWDPHLCARAAMRGHLDTLEYLRGAGCPWNTSVCRWSMDAGQTHALEWAHRGTRETWPCAENAWTSVLLAGGVVAHAAETTRPCDWAKEHKANEL